MAKYELLKQEGRAKRGTFHTVHGDIQTPVFMNVGTVGAIKGAVSTDDLKEIKCQVELSNTYHLHALLRSHKNLGTVNMRVEVHALLLYFAKTCM